ncbi:response regulator transcription factor [Lachnoclostridium sp. Marseille-P6806]|uniref:response regulator transcription factor n=1 Tax=Lachnoclostridium sp. Marseille-P6806 TaxID=2364793 RepID=UPI00103112E8|nr:response regulator transcription factor [Lachnoclostridium sp. Marseille-P6806]
MEVRDRVLVVEDDSSITNLMKTVLRANNYEVLTASTGAEAISLITSHCPDLVILDLGLPDMDGVSVLQQVRTWSAMPILVVSARTHERDKVEALDLGADDYIAKPFGTPELLARIRAALRHYRLRTGAGSSPQGDFFQTGALRIDYARHRVYVDGRDAGLTQNEFRIVAMLGRHAGRVITYDSIIREIWGPGAQRDNKILRVNMANIRRKIEKNPAQPEYICTETGVGYLMADGDSL